MKSEADQIIRPEHEGGSAHAHEASAEFVPGFQPEGMTKITVPGLADDARGISAEELAKVPTLTEQVSHSPAKAKPAAVVTEEIPIPEIVQVPEPEPSPAAAGALGPAQDPLSQAEPEATEPSELALAEAALEPQAAQDTPPAAESWVELCQVRIDQLSGEIQKLNDRLDQLEQAIKV